MKEIKFGLNIAVIIFVIIGLSGCSTDNEVSNSVRSEEKFLWKLVTAWPPNLPINHDTVEISVVNTKGYNKLNREETLKHLSKVS